MDAYDLTATSLRTQREAIAAARDLYDRLYRDLRADAPDADGAALEAAYQKGEATLATLDSTASDLPLSADTRELLAGFLEGPAEDDLESRRAWLTLLPELMVDVRRAEEAQHASLIQPAYGSRGLAWEGLGTLFSGIREVEAVLVDVAWPSLDQATGLIFNTAVDWKYFAEESARYVLTSWTDVVVSAKIPAPGSRRTQPERTTEPTAKRISSYALAA